jgi:AbiJ N-terminal domain 4
MEKPFSERIGAVSGRDAFQVGSMDQGLRNRLLNCLMTYGPPRRNGTTDRPSASARLIWDGFFKLPLHQLTATLLDDVLQGRMATEPWHEVYDLIEFVCKECAG